VNHFGMFCVTFCALAVLAIMTSNPLSAADDVKVGDKAPVFQGTDEQGKTWKSTDHVGKKILVVYFYPADFTGGCTAQACGFRDDSKALADKGIEVVGVSGDSVQTHAAFKKEHKLDFTLLSDGKGELANKFGVKFNKKESKAKFKDQTFVRDGSAERYTVIIDKSGIVVAHYNAAKDPGGDSKKVLEVVQKLQK
jgi:peroxiredoxin Q/BCP